MSDTIETTSAIREPKRRSRFAAFWIRFLKEKPLGTACGIIILILILVATLTALIVSTAISTDWNTWDSLGFEVSPGGAEGDVSNTEQGIKNVFGNTTVVISTLIMTRFVLPMEVVSVVLLAAVIGALALVRDTEVES